MNNLTRRILTALVAGSVSIAAIVWSPLGLWVFCTLIALVSVWEFYEASGLVEKRYRYVALAGAAMIWIYLLLQLLLPDQFGSPRQAISTIAILILPILSLFALFNKAETQPVQTLGALMLGLVYPFLPIVLLYLVSVPDKPEDYVFWLPLGILLITWVLDSGAYMVGRLIGKHPLFPRISPKKTWEGSIGGAVLAMGVGFALQHFVPMPSCNWLIIAAIISVFSQTGDLVESMYKRSVELKDSGSILPGHGGMLDRFDGVFLSMPFLFLYFSLC